ncbi:MAG TPA: hypothetical protein VGH28_01025 [Polyangiaceae bacterium]|jgi:hypothetical protein
MADLPLFGVNLPWIDGAYGHDLAPNERFPTWPCEFDTMRSYLPLIQAAEIGFGAIRVWLCENGEGIVTDRGQPAKPHERLLESIAVIEECARLLGLRVYWTLLDGNAWKREGDHMTHAILADADACARFAENVAAPIVAKLDPAVTFAVEVVNEPESLSPNCVKEDAVPWHVLGRSIRVIGDALRSARPGVMVTAGTAHVYLAQLHRAEAGIDAYDVHVYHKTGGLPSREELAAAAGDDRIATRAVPLILGEGGVVKKEPAEATVSNYLFNARKLGYDAAFIWQLDKLLVEEGNLTETARTLRTTIQQLATRHGGSK